MLTSPQPLGLGIDKPQIRMAVRWTRSDNPSDKRSSDSQRSLAEQGG
jgi:hypothetical protein